MNGRTHAAIGFAVPTSFLAAGSGLVEVAFLGLLAAGAALGPDIDHPDATASKALGSTVHRSVHAVSKVTRLSSSTALDLSDAHRQEALKRDPDHRGLTHTGLASLAVGFAVLLVGLVPFTDALLGLLCGWLLGHVVRRVAATALMAAGAVLGLLVSVPAWMMAVAVAGGWLSHVLADGCTMAGVPLLWPIRHKGKRWYRFRFMGSLLRSGARAELAVAVSMIAVLAFPAMVAMLGNHG